MRKKIAAGNWKMNKTIQEGIKLFDEIQNGLTYDLSDDILVIVALPSTHLHKIIK